MNEHRKRATDDHAALKGIQEVARELGLTMRALRFYEDKGLITPQRVGTTRIYGKREVARARLVLRGRRLGFTIREIKEFPDLYNVDPKHAEQKRRGKGARRGGSEKHLSPVAPSAVRAPA